MRVHDLHELKKDLQDSLNEVYYLNLDSMIIAFREMLEIIDLVTDGKYDRTISNIVDDAKDAIKLYQRGEIKDLEEDIQFAIDIALLELEYDLRG